MPTMTMDVGVVLQRRKARTQWQDWIWEARAVLPEPAAADAGASLGQDGDDALFYGGNAVLEAHTIETQYYRDNLSTGEPKIWVILRPGPGDAAPELIKVTCDPTEGEGYTETGWDTVNALPMPESIQAALIAFIDQHHVDQPFIKRKRDRQDPEALAAGRRGPDRDRFLRDMQAKAADSGGTS
jgi:hypothetical protein